MYRLHLAELSRERLLQRRLEWRSRDDALTRLLNETRPRVETEMDDEEAYERRRLESAASRMAARRQEEKIARKANADLRSRLQAVHSRTDDGDNKGLFGADVHLATLRPLERDSTTSASTFSKLVAMEAV